MDRVGDRFQTLKTAKQRRQQKRSLSAGGGQRSLTTGPRQTFKSSRREASQHAFQAAAEVVCADHLRVPAPVRTSAPLGAVVTRSWITAAGRPKTPPTFQGIKDCFYLLNASGKTRPKIMNHLSQNKTTGASKLLSAEGV